MAALDHYFPTTLRKMAAIASIAAGVQFGWALQLSLLTPYIQSLGVPHKWAANIWLCGPVSGLIVQPLVGYYSDRSRTRFGRRRPFIFFGVIVVAIAASLIGYAADLGHIFGDQLGKKTKPRAVAIFSVPFALASIYSTASGAGQGLYLGVLNISIVIPQIFISILSGPLDSLFGGSNLPAFTVGAVAAIISAVLAIALLPTPAPEEMANAPIGGGLH